MAIGLSILAVALVSRQLISRSSPDVFAAQLLADALLIFGWAAMWEPITVLLYELWPIVQKKRVYQKISEMEIEIQPLYLPVLGQTVEFFED